MRKTRLIVLAGALTALLALTPGASAVAQETADGGESYVEALNLHFEVADSPEGWYVGGEGYTAAIDKDEKHAGERSLRMACDQIGKAGIASSTFPIEKARGKRLRLAGHVKTADVTQGWAGLWMRIDGPDGPLGFDNMQQRGITASTPWTRYEIALDVPEEAVNIVFGALLTGDGIAWFDTFSFAFAELAGPPPPVTVTGRVTDPDGKAVAGAHVALVGAGRAAGRACSAEDGRFAIEVPAGDYAITATTPDLAAYLPPSRFAPEDAVEEQAVPLAREGFTISGRVSDDEDKPVAGTAMLFYRFSRDTGDTFYSETDDQGRYSVRLIPAESYTIAIESAEHIADTPNVQGGEDQTVDLTVSRRAPAADEVVAWIREHAIPLATPEAESGFDDMKPLRELVGDARVVGLGEATHGTREFFQFKHRMLEFLVEEMGFTVFAIEANWPESLAINDYVVEGKGNAKDALAGIYFWTWNTEEVLELIEWMRRYNADAKHETKIKFYGFDMQTPVVAAREAVAYLSRADPAYAQKIDALLDPLEQEPPRESYQALSDAARRALVEGIDEVLERLDAERPAFVERSSEREWIVGRQQVVILQQVIKMYSGSEGFGYRDQAMAANLRWILDTEPPGTRVVAWAHNGHLSRQGSFGEPMGLHLTKALGDDYVVLGFAFNQGSFQAIDWTQGRGRPGGLHEHTVGPAPAENLGAAFARTGLPIFVLDLRRRPAEGKVAGWFEAPHPMRAIGAVFTNEQNMSQPIVLPEHFDAVLFVDRTTRARPVERE
ncbi:MAG: erythromycin esterase [bacterium]|nr:erythromycin esterase [bacterium]